MRNFHTKEKAAIVATLLLAPPLCMMAQEDLSSCMVQLQERYRIHFVYDASLQHLLDTTKTTGNPEVTFTLKAALKETFEGSPVTWRLHGRNVVLKATSAGQRPEAEDSKKEAREENDS